jgi:hypothetical protein
MENGKWINNVSCVVFVVRSSVQIVEVMTFLLKICFVLG